MKWRTIFLIVVLILTLWFLYLARAILAPFVLAAIFAYIFNPIVDFFSHKIRLPRALVIFIIYAVIIISIVAIGSLATRRVIEEFADFRLYTENLISTTRTEINQLPDWATPFVTETLSSLKELKIFSPQSVFLLFPAAISRVLSLMIFLVAGFYFLKDGKKMIDHLITFVPKQNRTDVEVLLRKINTALNGYLRGQLILIGFMAVTLYIAYSILGVRFALILAILSGFLEIIPIIGPFTATAITVFVILLTGVTGFSLTPIQGAIAATGISFIIRQFQDYVIAPSIMARITQIHPFLVFFAVLSGGHLLGILGYILAIPIAATIRILLEFSFDKLIALEK